jgi:hypothetical protein
VLLSAFRRDPACSALSTPSGTIEIFSATIDSFGYADCPGHPVWLEPAEWLGRHPSGYSLQLVANQPRRRGHRRRFVRPHLQRPRQLPGRRHAHRGRPARRGAAVHRRLVRPRSRRPVLLPPRQPERAHRRPAQLRPLPGHDRPARHGRDRTLRCGAARGLGPPSAGDGGEPKRLAAGSHARMITVLRFPA